MTTPHKNLIIRADADTRMGTGHVMRCIALAQAWQDRGGNVTFLSHCDSKALRQRIIDEGFDFIPIEKPHPDPDDLKKTLIALKQKKDRNSKLETWIVLDGYHFTPEYQRAVKENGYKLLVIDDMAHLNHYYADVLLNQNIYAASLNYASDKETVKLLGCEYVLLRREFIKYKDWKRKIPDKAKKIIVTMGGSDPNNVTLKVVKALNILSDSDIEVNIIVGPANPNIKSIEKELHNSPFRYCLLTSVNDMSKLMACADVAISAAGSTCWELCFMRVPSLTVVTAENQRNAAMGLERAEIFKTVGWHNAMNNNVLVSRLSVLIRDKKQRENISRLGRQLIDGKGAKNIVHALSEQCAMKH